MVVKRTLEPWMPAADFGRSLNGIGINLLVREIEPMLGFCRDILGATIIHADEDFAAIELARSVFMLHADHTYSDHELSGIVGDSDDRGVGVEIRVYGVDPDAIESRARAAGHHVLSASADKPHGLRECHLIAPHGYVFVPARAILP